MKQQEKENSQLSLEPFFVERTDRTIKSVVFGAASFFGSVAFVLGALYLSF